MDEMFPHTNLPEHLAYVHWFTPFSAAPDANNGLYKISHSIRGGQREASVVAVNSIKRSVHLFPSFGRVAPQEWTSANVLEQCKTFYLNPFSDHHSYITMY